jgi:hypothetical protein
MINKLWLLNALPAPAFIPKRMDVVFYIDAGRRALVVTNPRDPDELFELNDDIETRPCICDLLVGEEIVKNVDVSRLRVT